MKIKVLYFASLKEKLGTDGEQLEAPAGITTVGELRAHLGARGGAFAEAFAGKKLVKAAVNQEMVDATATIQAGDEVAFFPPVTGG